MNPVAYHDSDCFSRLQTQSCAMLAQLRGAHDQLATEIENLDRLTNSEKPAAHDITNGRWRISQASLKRRSLACRIFDFLAGRLDRADLATLKGVQAADREMMRRSASHVGNWTMNSISSDWQGYCAASRQIRMHMTAHIEFERQSLYPLLERLASQGSRPRPSTPFPAGRKHDGRAKRRPAETSTAGPPHIRHAPVGTARAPFQ